MPITTTTLQQCEIRDGPRSAMARHYSLTDLAELRADFHAAISSEETYVVGVSVELAKKGACVQTLVLALRDQVFCLSLGQRLNVKQRQVMQELFSNIHYLTGFEMPYTIVLLAQSLGFNMSGYDLTTTRAKSRAMTPGEFWNSINPSVSAHRVDKRWDGGVTRGKWNPSGTPRPNYAIRAWFTAMAADKALLLLPLEPPLSTGFITRPMLRLLVDLATRAIRIDLAKPRIKENDFAKVYTKADGGIDVTNARFKTRIRESKQSRLEVHLANGDIVKASIMGVKGRLSSAAPERRFTADVSRIRVIGREEPTSSEEAQYCFLVLSLTGPRKVPLFVNVVWFPKNNQARGCDENIDLSCGHAFRALQRLNDSQKEVVAAMVSTAPCDSLVIAHANWSLIYKLLARYGYDIGVEVRNEPIQFVRDEMEKGTARPSLALENLLEEEKLSGPERELANETTLGALGSLYAAGSDTTASLLVNFLLAMLLYPDIVRKAQRELDAVTGRERLPTFEDRSRLSFVDAVGKEASWWRPIAALGVPHATTQDDVYDGYFIPKGAIVIGNTWAIMHDPALYPEPDVFKPERFLGPDGTLLDDPIVASAFGWGKRICPGRHFVDATMFIVVSSLLSVFNIEKVQDAEDRPFVYSYKGSVIRYGTPTASLFDGANRFIGRPHSFPCSIVPRDKRAGELVIADTMAR